MFLAINEIKRNKLRYILVFTVIVLITYMIFFISSLALGLAILNRNAIDNWDATSAVLSEYANDNIISSNINEDVYSDYQNDDNVAELGQVSVVINEEDSSKKIDSSIFAIDFDSFLSPEIIEGRLAKNDQEVVIDKSFINDNIKLNSEFIINGSEEVYKVVGVTENNNFFTAPLIFTTIDSFQKIKFGSENAEMISALVVKDDSKITGEDLDQISIKTLINNIPGYTAQVYTFAFMIGAMVIITFLIVAIFMYIITLQKISIFAIMRAQGISSGQIVYALFSQILIIAVAATLMSYLLILLSELFLPATMPFYSNNLIYLVMSLAIIIMALLGGLLSLNKVLKIDPVSVIGGE